MDGSAVDLLLEHELAAVESISQSHGWNLSRPLPRVMHLDLPAKGGQRFFLHADLEGYAASPPAWHWRDPDTGVLSLPARTPIGGNFFHGHGVICAPWNRLAYKVVDARGPHSDWTLATWKLNSKTGGTRTLSAMVLRIAHELAVNNLRRLG
jgi:hypothetical protein